MNQESVPYAGCRSFLSSDESARADRFTNLSAQRQFVITRCTLRRLIGRYTGIAPQALVLKTAAGGKPYPALPPTLSLACNVSHTENLALIAISGGCPVGIDIETMTRAFKVEELARRFFSEREAYDIEQQTQEERVWWFLTYWTCKEAFLKMQGSGLGADLSTFAIEWDPNDPSAFISGMPPPDSAAPYVLLRINPGNGFVGAVAVEAPEAELSFFDWSPEVLSQSPSG